MHGGNKRMRSIPLVFLLAAITICPRLSLGESLAIVGGTIIDGTGKAPLVGTVSIKDGRINAIGPDVKVPAGAKKVDAHGKYVIPGLMDANVHLIGQTDLETLVKYDGHYEDIGLEAAQMALKYGLTTVFDTWGPRQPLTKARDLINSGQAPGSRFYLAGNIIGFGGPFSTDFLEEQGKYLTKTFVKRTNALWEENVGQDLMYMGPEQVRQEIRKYIATGVDFLKYEASGHMGTEDRYISFSPRVQHVIVEEGHRAGLVVQAHVTTIESLDLAVDAGLDIATHCEMTEKHVIPPETLQKMAERKVACSVLPITQRHLDALQKAAPESYEMWNIGKLNEKALIKAGVTLLLSTDAGLAHPIKNAEAAAKPEGAVEVLIDPRARLGEGHFNALQALQEEGMAPLQVLATATLNIARAYKKDQDLGSLETGKIADLVILDRNPLDDARNYRSINAVYKDGKRVDVGALPLNPRISSEKVPPELLPRADAQPKSDIE